MAELVQLAVWNKVHRVEDAVWDPRGKRALFEGLELRRPRILFLGSAEGYEAMQLSAMYPGGHVVMVDYDPFCRDVRFGEFPEAYPFLGADPATILCAVTPSGKPRRRKTSYALLQGSNAWIVAVGLSATTEAVQSPTFAPTSSTTSSWAATSRSRRSSPLVAESLEISRRESPQCSQ